MKGQFMLVSAVVAGLTMITVAAIISDVQSRTFEPEDTSYEILYLEDEASKLTSGSFPGQLERENYRKLVGELGYRSETSYWQTENCFNVTLTGPSERFDMTCLPDRP